MQNFKKHSSNTFQSYRLETLNFNADGAFKELDNVRNEMNSVEIFCDLIHNWKFQLISYDDLLNGANSPIQQGLVSSASQSTEIRLFKL